MSLSFGGRFNVRGISTKMDDRCEGLEGATF